MASAVAKPPWYCQTLASQWEETAAAVDFSPDDAQDEEAEEEEEEETEEDDPYEYDDEITPPDVRPRTVDDDLMLEVLCSNRVSQMTKTYNDIEAVTRLLEEKEKDLELTARIGKQLLADNQRLEATVAQLDTELRTTNEQVTQLTHELHKKTELIQILTNDVDDSGSEAGTPSGGLRSINLELLQKHVSSLEEENRSLRHEASQLAHETADCEQAEQRLVQELSLQLSSANQEMSALSVELERVKEESRLQHEEIVSLTCKLNDAETKLQKTTVENEELSSTLNITRDNQNKLAMELAEFKDRYAEVMNLLRDTQEQLRRQRRKGLPTARGGSLFPSLNATANPDSIASELESSLYSELSLDSGISTDKPSSFKKVFETVRCASRGSAHSTTSSSPIHQMYPRLSTGATSVLSSTASTGPRMSAFASTAHAASSPGLPLHQSPAGLFPVPPPHHRPTPQYGSALSFPSLDSVGQSDSESSMMTDSEPECYPGGARPGVPGVPGAADLEDALRRLTPAEVIARRAMLSSGAFIGYEDGGTGGLSPPTYLPYGCRTPDSIMSTGSSGLSGFSGHSNGWKLPEKLQIVKPMEGSLTLAAWSQLATPTLGGLLDERPGVKTRGGRPLEELGLHTYTLSDLEEDDEDLGNPGKSFQSSSSIYTYTNSTVLHPDDNTTVTHSLQGSQMCPSAPMSHQISRQSTAPPTPGTRSRRNSTSTFSTTLGLAKLLNERGIKAVTPSAVATPCHPSSFTPTATPCNSPDGTPPPSPPASPPPYNPLKLGFLSSGADLLRRTFSAENERVKPIQKQKRSKMSLSRSDRKALTGIRLVEKLERIGLETIMSTTASSMSPLTLQGSLYSRRTLKSPMAQLTSFKNTITSPAVSSKVEPPRKEPLLEQLSSPRSRPISEPKIGSKMKPGELGVPCRPGTGALDRLSSHRQPSGMVRPDLGTVFGNGPPVRGSQSESCVSPALGSVSSMSLGRKGGLL
ncbi:hypothetical protein R5R35_011998 [Gryllus longicercus]|uniref:Trafficking kinesin-binding protein milt n=2 Tax=Gryllus longicercus TaxID=2509291 RepID=A0AAN9VTL0_9ORTH